MQIYLITEKRIMFLIYQSLVMLMVKQDLIYFIQHYTLFSIKNKENLRK